MFLVALKSVQSISFKKKKKECTKNIIVIINIYIYITETFETPTIIINI